MTMEELKKLIADAGCVGAGGAGFPSAVKLAQGADSLVINAAECEPLLYTDYALMENHLADVVAGAELVIAGTGIRQGYLSLKQHTAEHLGLEDGQPLSDHVKVKVLPNAYPMGDEIILIYQTLGRIVPPGQLPITVGAIVYNAETLYNIFHAVKDGRPVTQKWIMIGGKVDHTFVTVVPVGTPVRELLKAYNVTLPEDCVLVDGGPAMGNIIDPRTAIVTKTTKALLVLPRTTPAIRSKLATNRTVAVHASANCCQCTLCTDMCPRALIGYPLKPHRIVRNSVGMIEENPSAFTEAATCCNCGICELVACCQGISPRRMYQQAKGILIKNKLRYEYKGEPLEADPHRDHRLLPSDRFKRMIGVAPFDKGVPQMREEAWLPKQVELLLHQHVGAPAKPVVKEGDAVSANQLVAQADGVISANIHSPVNGKVVSVTTGKVVIRVAE